MCGAGVCYFRTILKKQAGNPGLERNTLENQTLTLLLGCCPGDHPICVAFFLKGVILFFLYDYLCDWELVENKPNPLLTGWPLSSSLEGRCGHALWSAVHWPLR